MPGFCCLLTEEDVLNEAPAHSEEFVLCGRTFPISLWRLTLGSQTKEVRSSPKKSFCVKAQCSESGARNRFFYLTDVV